MAPRLARAGAPPRQGQYLLHEYLQRDGAARVALFSNRHEFGIIEYPDSAKMGVGGRHDEALDHVVRRSPDLDYWDGERADAPDANGSP